MAKVFNNLLLEDGSRLLLENGDALLLEQYYYYEALIASLGSFTLTGFDAILFKGRRMVLDVGAYVLTGQEIVFNIIKKMAISVGSFTLTGIDIAFHKGYQLFAGVGNYVLSGQGMTLSTATKNATTGSFEELTVSGTPTTTGIALLTIEAHSASTDAVLYIDTITIE